MRRPEQTIDVQLFRLVLALHILVVALAYCRLRQFIHMVQQAIQDDCLQLVQFLMLTFREWTTCPNKSAVTITPPVFPSAPAKLARDLVSVALSRCSNTIPGSRLVHNRLWDMSLFIDYLSIETLQGRAVSLRLDASCYGFKPFVKIKEVGSTSVSKLSISCA